MSFPRHLNLFCAAGLAIIACAPVNKGSLSQKKSALPEQITNKPQQSGDGKGTQDPQNSPPSSTESALVHSTQNLAGLLELKPLCGISTGKTAAETSAGRQIRIATFNMLGAFANSLDSLKSRMALAASEIQRSQADVVGIQEAEDMDPAGLTIAQLAQQMTALTGETWYWCFFRSNPHSPFEVETIAGGGGIGSAGMSVLDENTKKLSQRTWYMGDAILSRLPFGSAGARRISSRVVGEKIACGLDTKCQGMVNFESRVVVRAEILLQGRSIHVFNSHFYTNITSESSKSQVQQALEVNNYIAQTVAIKSAPAAVTCDCNSPESGAVRAKFIELGYKDSWSVVNPGKAGHTGGQDINSKQSTVSSRIDYIFTSNLNAKEAAVFPAEAANVNSPLPVWPSDHKGLVAGPF